MTDQDSSNQPDRYALVGHPVDHSYSPTIHKLFAKQTGETIDYGLIDANEDEFEIAVRGFKAAGGKGLNVTVPHKQRAYELAQSTSDAASRAQSVNTLHFPAGTIHGENTDGVGLLRDLRDNLSLELNGKRLLILGAGGAVRGIVGPLLDAGVEMTIANRTMERVFGLQRLFENERGFATCSFAELADLPPQDFVINATSAGVRGEELPFAAEIFAESTFCYDLSYASKDTPFVELARKHGAGGVAQGWGMLVEQAAESYYIWRGKRPPTREILERMPR